MSFFSTSSTRKTFTRRTLGLAAITALTLPALAACSDPGANASGASPSAASNGITYNLSPDQNRIQVDKDPAAAAKVPAAFASRGTLRVATTAGAAPLSLLATDNKTVIGSEVDIAQLVADKLGLKLDVQVTSWENWPLKTQSGDVDATFSNVGINKDRVKLFDFSSYRAAFMGFEAKKGSDLKINGADDISGKKISVGSGTNQEKILLAWNKDLESRGKAPATLSYYSSDADTILALTSGRTDLNLAPYPTAVYVTSTRSDLQIVGKVNAGWPSTTLVAATTKRGNGLAPAITEAINSSIKDGSYKKVLDRWGLGEEAVPEAQTITEENFGSSK